MSDIREAFEAIASFMERTGQPGDAHPVVRQIVQREVSIVRRAAGSNPGREIAEATGEYARIQCSSCGEPDMNLCDCSLP